MSDQNAARWQYELVIPCSTEEEAWEERADLHAAVEARSFIRKVEQ